MIWPFRKRRKTGRSIPVMLRARYDAAQTTSENARHWAMADGLSADGATSADVRRKLRDRARYEVANNSYAKGIVLIMMDRLNDAKSEFKRVLDSRRIEDDMKQKVQGIIEKIESYQKELKQKEEETGDTEKKDK